MDVLVAGQMYSIQVHQVIKQTFDKFCFVGIAKFKSRIHIDGQAFEDLKAAIS